MRERIFESRDCDCADVRTVLSALLDDQIEPEARYAAERHITGCAACRKMIDDAEALTPLLLTAAGGDDDTLPGDFVGSVLSRTVYSDGELHSDPRRLDWKTWVGWVAAAACLVLAFTVLMTTPRTLSNTGRDGALALIPTPVAPRVAQAHYDPNLLRSTVYDGEVLPGNDRGNRAANRNGLRHAAAALPRTEVETIETAANVLAMLLVSTGDDLARVTEAREIVEYEELIERLADSRRRIEPSEQAPLFAAEGFFMRLVQGSVSGDDLSEMRKFLRVTGLTGELTDLTDRLLPSAVF